jgi:hypothetical protein
LNGGLWGQIGDFGLTATADSLRYDVSAATSTVAVGITRLHLVGAYAFLHNQLCIGAGFRLAYVDISDISPTKPPNSGVISMVGLAPQAGLIVKPESRPWRVGLTARAPVSASTLHSLANLISVEQGDATVKQGSFILPSHIVQPWEIEAGIAYQLGPRPLNPPWVDPHEDHDEHMDIVRKRRTERAAAQRREIDAMPSETIADRAARAGRMHEMAREETQIRAAEDAADANADKLLRDERKARYSNWPRQRVLFLASVLMTGASHDAVALEGFIEQQRERVGTRVSMSPRFAIESEALPNLLKTRAGIYVEPSRFTDGVPREHFTVGGDVRLFAWSVFGIFPTDHTWQLSTFVDLAERYQNFGFSIGTWH